MGSGKIISLVGAATIFPTASQAVDDVRKLAEQTIRRLDLQTTFPNVPESPPFQFHLPAEVLWLVIVIALAVLVYSFRDVIPFFRLGQRGGWTADEAISVEAELRTSAATLNAADELAGHGRFVEAMHALLLHGLAVMRERLNEQFADSLTSREILYSANLPQDGRTSLHDIVTRVEWTYFGERPATRIDYDACRTSFMALTRSLHRGATA